MEGEINEPKKKSLWWVWLLVGVIIIAAAIYAVFYFISPGAETSSETNTENDLSTDTFKEDWQIEPEVVMKRTTSTDTHYFKEGFCRMYFMMNGEIKYAESSDCKNFNTSKSTGVSEPSGKMISNPAVLQISEKGWIMIYEQAPVAQPNPGKTPPGPATQRDLYLATSTDGKAFTKVGLVIDSSKEDNYFASVPDLVLLPDNSIRMYYVSGGEKIAVAASIDGGRSWKRQGVVLSGMAVDPDVLYRKTEGGEQWVMYYSNLDPQANAIYKATSSDGIEWSEGVRLFTATTGGGVVDPDVVSVSDDQYLMFLGQIGGGTAGGEEINLYRATLSQSIF